MPRVICSSFISTLWRTNMRFLMSIQKNQEDEKKAGEQLCCFKYWLQEIVVRVDTICDHDLERACCQAAKGLHTGSGMNQFKSPFTVNRVFLRISFSKCTNLILGWIGEVWNLFRELAEKDENWNNACLGSLRMFSYFWDALGSVSILSSGEDVQIHVDEFVLMW